MLTFAPVVLAAMLSAALASSPRQDPTQQVVPPITLPPIVVTAQKEPADERLLPVSVSVVDRATLDASGVNLLGEAAFLSPNTLFAEMSARKVSNPYIRGIGSSPSNPGVTTYIDGVPQLYANSSNLELIDVERVEFVRGAQSALFGRNALGGLVNLSTARPSMTGWTGRIETPLGNLAERGARVTASGPVADTAAVGLAVGARRRDGFTVNDVTGKTIDDRTAVFGRAQFAYMPTANWETRFIAGGERDRDGDYALNDLDEVRRNPYHAQRDVAGYANRDLWSSTILVRHEGAAYSFSSTTGGVWWMTQDYTDLDYSAAPLLTRTNREQDAQFTQEFRVASAARAPLRISGDVTMAWQAGLMLFSQRYTQNATTTFAPYVLSPWLSMPVDQHSPSASLDDRGLGMYAAATLTAWKELGVTFGARFDREHRAADIRSSYAPEVAPSTRLQAGRTYSDVSPQAAVTWRPVSTVSIYASTGSGFKAGGFNAWAPPGSESYGEEHAWTAEAGVKTRWAGGRVLFDAAYYRVDWNDMQLTVPAPGAPAQFYIANVGHATSSGVEVTMTARPAANIQLHAALGTTDGKFGAESMSGGVNVSGNRLPLAPDYTASVGLALSARPTPSLEIFAGGDVVSCGSYRYDDQNLAGQSAYALVNLRGGFRVGKFGVDAWVHNAFDTRYVPLALPYGSLAPSGFIGEPGAPRRFGITAHAGF